MDKNAMMQTLARAAYEKGCFNGVWLYAENGRIVSTGAYGFRDPENRLPMQEDSVFEIASVSKQFTATAILLLVRQGKLSLDDEITAFFPELGAYTGVTVRHLLTHTGGVPDYCDDNDFAAWFVKVWAAEKRIPSNGDALRFLTQSGAAPVGAPGERFEYSNTGYNLLAELVERLSGVPFEDFVKKNVFAPAGMDDTAVCHVRRDGLPSDRFVRAMVLEDGRYLLPEDSEEHYDEVAVDGLNGDAHVYTTVFDMLKWDRALREEKVLTLAEQRMMYAPSLLNDGSVSGADDDRDGYGLGWGVVNDEKLGLLVSHSGGMSGIGTWFERGVDTDRAFIFANTRDYPDVRAYWSFAYGMVALSRDREPGPVESIEDLAAPYTDRSLWEGLCGSYVRIDDETRRLEIYLQDGDLYWKDRNAAGKESVLRLYQIGEKEFGFKDFDDEISVEDGSILINGKTYKKQ